MRRVGPRHEFGELAREVAVDDLQEGIGHVGLRIDAIELTGLCRPPNYVARVRYGAPL